MEKLELKHWCAYMPYDTQLKLGSSVIWKPNIDCKPKIKGADATLNPDLLADIYNGTFDSLSKFKLCLHPMLNLTKEIERNGEIVNVIEEIYNESWMALGYVKYDYGKKIKIVCKEDGSNLDIYLNKPQVNMWWVTQLLIKYHFDIFNLIPEGLAVDINTLK